MEIQILTDEEKHSFCQVIPAQIEFEWVLSIQGKYFIESIQDFFSYSQLELTCDLPQKENSGVNLNFKPNQRKTITVSIPYLKETTKFIWYFSSNRQIDINSILNSIIISFRCLEN